MKELDLFSAVLDGVKDGMKITFPPKNVAFGDDFLIFNKYRRKQTITFHTKSVPSWIEFDGDEPMLLEDVPTSFLESILKNIPRA
jgi:hypothetical protein